MIHVALLRGINVGGNRKVEMPRLRTSFQDASCRQVRTFINSGNIMFEPPPAAGQELGARLEQAVEQAFGFAVPIMLRSLSQLDALLSAVPASWVNDETMRCDVMFLSGGTDPGAIIQSASIRGSRDDVLHLPGAVVWRVDRQHVRPGQTPPFVSTPAYRQLTVRNINTVRKLHQLMQQLADEAPAQ